MAVELLSVISIAFLTKQGNNHIAAPSLMLLVSYDSLKVARNLIIEMGSFGSKKCAFICGYTFLHHLGYVA